MSDAIEITVDPTRIPVRRILAQLHARQIGVAGRAKLVLGALAAFAAVLAFGHWILGAAFTVGSAITAFYALFAAVIAYALVLRRLMQGLERRAENAPYAQPVLTFRLDASGLRGGTTQATWPQVQAVHRLFDATILQLTPFFFVILPDSGLPVGLAPDALRQRIAEWRGQ